MAVNTDDVLNEVNLFLDNNYEFNEEISTNKKANLTISKDIIEAAYKYSIQHSSTEFLETLGAEIYNRARENVDTRLEITLENTSTCSVTAARALIQNGINTAKQAAAVEYRDKDARAAAALDRLKAAIGTDELDRLRDAILNDSILGSKLNLPADTDVADDPNNVQISDRAKVWDYVPI